MGAGMRKLPEAEQELMMIVWDARKPITRVEIEQKLDSSRNVVPSTILTLLSRLEAKGFLTREKRGKINYYEAAVEKEPYLKETGKNVIKKLFGNSVKNFMTALYDGEELSAQDMDELQEFLNQKRGDV